jgi:hypothetical protein
LGVIGGFYCTLETTDVGNYGPKSPMYFCMDKLQVRIKGTPEPHIAVTNILNVPDSATVGIPLLLTGKVLPEDATHQTIIWSIKDAGFTGATLMENTLYTTDTGTVTMSATILDGLTVDENYVQDFEIVVTKIPVGVGEMVFDDIRIYSYRNTIYINHVWVENFRPIPMVEIWDMTGRLVHREKMYDNNTTLKLSEADGIYLIRVIFPNHDTISKKILIKL